jgi:hypothetical protein
MSEIKTNYTVQKGDCAWSYAKKSIANQGKKVSNAEIVKEMNRLAKLNNCNSVDEFNNKYFSKIGSVFSTTTATTPTTTTQIPTQRTTTPAPADSPASRETTEPQKIEKTKTTTTPKNKTLTEEEKYANKINSMSNDTDKIIEYNKKNYNGDYYGIVDKKTCQLKIYNKKGEVVKSYTVGVGKSKGDNMSAGYYMDRKNKTDKAYLAESNRYTTAGEFTLDEIPNIKPAAYTGKDGELKMMQLKGDNKGVNSGQMAIHMLYKPQYAKRKAAIESAGLEDNRMSYGCVNLLEEDYNSMHSYLGEGNKIYILPEEKGNKLILEKQKDGSYKFEQAYHRNDARGASKEVASRVSYDVRPENNPKYIAKKKAEAAAKETQSQVAANDTNSKSWWNPLNWFS